MSNKRLANIPDGPNTRTTRPLAGRQFAALMDALCATFSFEEIRSLAREGLGIEIGLAPMKCVLPDKPNRIAKKTMERGR